MKLDKSIDKMLFALVAVTLVVVFGLVYATNSRKTYADNENGVAAEEYFVNFYDGGKKLTVKTTAGTVGMALERAKISLEVGDIVEPGLDEVIDSDNYFVNIYRARPVIVKDGIAEKVLMIASYDPQTIAKEAGIILYDGDEVVLEENTNFLETGPIEVYVVKRDEERLKLEAEARAEAEAARELAIAEEKVNMVVVNASPLTARMGRNRYTVQKADGVIVERQETYYDLQMWGVMAIAARECGAEAYYTVREDGVKVDAEGYVLVAANLNYYPRCSVVKTSLGLGRVYDTGSFAEINPEQFDLATDWTNRNGQ